MGYSNTSDYRIKTTGTGGGQALGSKPVSRFNPTAKGLSLSPQQLTAIKNSPKGKFPRFIANTIKSKEPGYAIPTKSGYKVKPLSKHTAENRLYASVFGDKFAK